MNSNLITFQCIKIFGRADYKPMNPMAKCFLAKGRSCVSHRKIQQLRQAGFNVEIIEETSGGVASK